MKINSEHPLLLNMQYVEGNRKAKIPDYMYCLWKDLDTGEKHLECIPEPMMDIYFEKMKFRNHDNYIRSWARLSEVDKYTCKYKDIKFAILNEMGTRGKELWQNILDTKNFRRMKEIDLYPYVYGHDINIETYYRNAWMNTMPKPETYDINCAFLDIETDAFDTGGFSNPETDPIDTCTIIDEKSMKSYTFALVGRDYIPRDTSHLNEEAANHIHANDVSKQKWHERRHRQEEELMNDIDSLKEELHQMFDDVYGEIDYNFYFYRDEAEMIVHIFQLIHSIEPDFMFIWNISFDANYFIERCKALGLDPVQVMCHPDFPVKQLYFKKDTHNFEVKNKSDYLYITDKTVWYDDMILYAAKRKGGAELPSFRLNAVGEAELNDTKIDYSEETDIVRFSYMNYRKYIIYNIKDVLLQKGIDNNTKDSQTLYVSSYENLTSYADVFKQTVVLRNVQYYSHLKNGFIPGANENGILASMKPRDDKPNKKKKPSYDGAVVGDPRLIGNFGAEMFGKPTNYLFLDSIDMDMSAFYPNTNELHNIEAPALIFKCIIPSEQFSVHGGNIPYKGITDVQILEDNKSMWDVKDDDTKQTKPIEIGKEIIDNFQSDNYLSLGYKFLNLPSYEDLEEELIKEFGD